MSSHPRLTLPVAGLLAACLFTPLSSYATLLVYEGFNGYADGLLGGVTPNSNTIGLDTSVGYYDGPSARTDNYTIQSTGLSLGSLASTGGALHFASGTNVIGADINIGGTAYTGTLWSSYLVNLSLQGLSTGDGAVVRIGATPADSNAGHFNSYADSRTGSKNIGSAYAQTTINGTGSPLALNTTYILINKFTRVGQSVNGTSPGVATTWALDETQFANFLSAGGDEAALNSVVITSKATSSATSGTSNTFSSSTAFGLVTVGDIGTFDEIRFGSELIDVTPTAVPEPASAAFLVGLGSIALCLSHRQRRLTA